MKIGPLWKMLCQEEDGSQFIEFIATLPFLLSTILIGWQFLVAGHTFIVTANAAREGARALAVCNATPGDAISAVRRSLPNGYNPMTNPMPGGGSVSVEVTNQIQVIDIFISVKEWIPPVTFKATMRKETCRR